MVDGQPLQTGLRIKGQAGWTVGGLPAFVHIGPGFQRCPKERLATESPSLGQVDQRGPGMVRRLLLDEVAVRQ